MRNEPAKSEKLDTEYPKMLYRTGKVMGAKPVFGHPEIFYVIAADAEEARAMSEGAGFCETIEQAKAAGESQKPAKQTDETGSTDDREALVKEAEALGIKPGKKGVKKLREEIEQAKAAADEETGGDEGEGAE